MTLIGFVYPFRVTYVMVIIQYFVCMFTRYQHCMVTNDIQLSIYVFIMRM